MTIIGILSICYVSKKAAKIPTVIKTSTRNVFDLQKTKNHHSHSQLGLPPNNNTSIKQNYSNSINLTNDATTTGVSGLKEPTIEEVKIIEQQAVRRENEENFENLARMLGAPQAAVRKIVLISAIILVITVSITYGIWYIAVDISRFQLLDEAMVKQEQELVITEILQLFEMAELPANIWAEKLVKCDFKMYLNGSIMNDDYYCDKYTINLRKIKKNLH